MSKTGLTKSHYAASLQCPRRLWLQIRSPARAGSDTVDASERLREGREVGRLARLLFPAGHEIVAEDFEAARAETQARLGQEQVLFEAAFEVEGLRVRSDVLEELGEGRLRLCEVKASTSLRDEHLDDASFQYWVLRRAGLDVVQVEIIQLSPDYERSESALDLDSLLVRRDVTDEVLFLAGDLEEQIPALRSQLEAADPETRPGRQCLRPRRCEFWDFCHASLAPGGLAELPRLSTALRAQLDEAGIERISEIPDTVELRPVQARAREALRRNEVVVEKSVALELARLAPSDASAFYLDFESWAPAIPPFAEARPYEKLPFQWSCHERTPTGDLHHAEFLYSGSGDPRAEFAASLIQHLETRSGRIAVYSSFEATVLSDLADRLPELRAGLHQIRERLFDLLVVLRDGVYHPEFRGSFSLKRVGPVLAPDFSYSDLDLVSDGAAAAVAGRALLLGEGTEGERSALRDALLAYCERDTLALVRLHAALSALVVEG